MNMYVPGSLSAFFFSPQIFLQMHSTAPFVHNIFSTFPSWLFLNLSLVHKGKKPVETVACAYMYIVWDYEICLCWQQKTSLFQLPCLRFLIIV